MSELSVSKLSVSKQAGFDRVAIIGLGLIGGSLAAGLRQQGLVGSITAFDTDENALTLGRDLGVIDDIAASIEDAANNADLVVIAVPVRAMQETLSHLAPRDQLVTDVGSVKVPIIEAARAVFGEVPANFVPGHPIAGSEKHGVIAANPKLFQRHRVILTPTDLTQASAVERVTKMWQALGADVVTMTAEHHDTVLAQTSHLPHLLAYALVDTLSSGGDSLEVFQYAAGGFRDFSRIAASDPTMWSDIFETNREPLLRELDKFSNEISELKSLIETGNVEAVKEILTRAKAARDHFSSIEQSRQSDEY